MKIFLATDHAGFALKEKIKPWLRSLGYEVEDQGAFELTETDDYPDFVHVAAERLIANPGEDRALIFGWSGQGEAMVANRHPGVRAAVYYGGPAEIIVLSREHNAANVLSIGARFVDEDRAKEMIELWLQTPFSDEERHARRIAKIDHYQSKL